MRYPAAVRPGLARPTPRLVERAVGRGAFVHVLSSFVARRAARAARSRRRSGPGHPAGASARPPGHGLAPLPGTARGRAGALSARPRRGRAPEGPARPRDGVRASSRVPMATWRSSSPGPKDGESRPSTAAVGREWRRRRRGPAPRLPGGSRAPVACSTAPSPSPTRRCTRASASRPSRRWRPGVPVVATPAGAVPEVVGDAAELVGAGRPRGHGGGSGEGHRRHLCAGELVRAGRARAL